MILLTLCLRASKCRVEAARSLPEARRRGEHLLREAFPGRRMRFDFYECEPLQNGREWCLSAEEWDARRGWIEADGFADVTVTEPGK